ncbi:MAG: UDP-glucose/GDP-mannose dehydrogenase family protein [Nitrosotalea sp.]
MNYKISVIGCGYVGLSLSVVCAKRGIVVYGVDNDIKKIDNLKRGIPPFYEPNLKRDLKDARKNLIFTTDLAKAVLNSTIIFVTVGTPQNSNGEINLTYINEACKQIGSALIKSNEEKIIVIKSTVVPGTTNSLSSIVESNSMSKMGKSIFIATNPEFLREGRSIYDTENPHLIVIGSKFEKARKILTSFYKDLYKKKIPKIIYCNESTAEVIKYSNNAFLATKISFINSIANLCQKIPGADINLVAEAIGEDKRIGKEFLNAGPGFGGSCLPKDVSAFLSYGEKIGVPLSVLSAVNEVNENQSKEIIEFAKDILQTIKNKKISILGLAFKKDTDDIRNAVSLKVIEHLLRLGAKIVVHDPMAIIKVRDIFGQKISYANSIRDCLHNSDLSIILTEWDEYKNLKPVDFLKSMRKPNVIDARRIFEPDEFKKDLNFHAIGLGP